MGSFSLPMRLIGGKSSAIVPRKETKTPVVICAGALRAFQANKIITVQSAAIMVISTTSADKAQAIRDGYGTLPSPAAAFMPIVVPIVLTHRLF